MRGVGNDGIVADGLEGGRGIDVGIRGKGREVVDEPVAAESRGELHVDCDAALAAAHLSVGIDGVEAVHLVSGCYGVGVCSVCDVVFHSVCGL